MSDRSAQSRFRKLGFKGIVLQQKPKAETGLSLRNLRIWFPSKVLDPNKIHRRLKLFKRIISMENLPIWTVRNRDSIN